MYFKIKKEEDDDKIHFPRIVMCMDSMHSREKIRTKFPNLTPEDIMLLYGQNASKNPWENNRGTDNILWALKESTQIFF